MVRVEAEFVEGWRDTAHFECQGLRRWPRAKPRVEQRGSDGHRDQGNDRGIFSAIFSRQILLAFSGAIWL